MRILNSTKNLDSVSRQENAATLSNHITSYMIQHGMTVENLDDACVLVKELYRKDAIIKG